MLFRSWLLLDADLAWTRARFVDDNANGDVGHLIPNAVPRVGLLGLTLHRLGPWSGGVTTRYIGGYPLSQDGGLTSPSSAVTNLQIRRSLTPHCALTLDLLNLFNRSFYDIAYQQDYRLTPTAPVQPQGVTEIGRAHV